MRYTHYLRKVLATGEVQRIPFAPSHYTQAGLLPSTGSGMPVLEAHQIVNKWNISQDGLQAYVYGLE